MIKQILFYTRPWEVKFHIELGKALSIQYSGAVLKFVTFFYDTHQYLVSQKFHSILFTEELKKISQLEDISKIDKELNQYVDLNLNLLAAMERFLPKNRKAANEFIVRHTMVLDELVTENTLSISSMFDHFVYLLGGILANIRKGYHFAFLMSGMPANRVIALKTPWKTWQVNYPSEYGLSLLQDAKQKLDTPAAQRIAYMNLDWQIPINKRIVKTARDYYHAQVDFNRGNYFSFKPLNRIKYNLKNRLSKIVQTKINFDINSLADLEQINTDFIYCALHMEPEATILMYSPWLRDQVEMCRLISQAMPVDTLLLVKENPKMIGVRSNSFYKKLREFHNIKLVSTKIESNVLINKSIGVITLAGNACLEASVLDRNSLCFGNPPFGHVVQFSNFLNHSNINELNSIIIRWKDSPIKGIEMSKWHNWINGTFSGNLIPQKNEEERKVEIIVTEETLRNCAQYLTAIIEHEKNV